MKNVLLLIETIPIKSMFVLFLFMKETELKPGAFFPSRARRYTSKSKSYTVPLKCYLHQT
jgi:hypothetical protein